MLSTVSKRGELVDYVAYYRILVMGCFGVVKAMAGWEEVVIVLLWPGGVCVWGWGVVCVWTM